MFNAEDGIRKDIGEVLGVIGDNEGTSYRLTDQKHPLNAVPKVVILNPLGPGTIGRQARRENHHRVTTTHQDKKNAYQWCDHHFIDTHHEVSP